MLDTFPRIKEAALLIAYDNGKIHRYNSVEDYLVHLNEWVELILANPDDEFNLYFIEAELASYCETLYQACCGSDSQEITGIDTMVDRFLDALFEEV